jgi:hypothetical protein
MAARARLAWPFSKSSPLAAMVIVTGRDTAGASPSPLRPQTRRLARRPMNDAHLPVLEELEADACVGGWAVG